jgi:uncharacterized membrane protein
MDNYISVVFSNDQQAAEGLHQLWSLDALGEITVHGAAVLHRDDLGYVHVATKHTDPGVRTAVGIGLGALLGALAGPIGAAAGAAAAAAAGVGPGIGAAAGGVVGLTADATTRSPTTTTRIIFIRTTTFPITITNADEYERARR